MAALLVHSSWRLSDQLPAKCDAEETEMPRTPSQSEAPFAAKRSLPEEGFWSQIAAAGPKTVSDALTPDELSRLHIDLSIEPFLADQVANGVSVFLTGNAGDGKTHVLRMLAPKLRELGAVVVEDATASMRRNQITPVLERWRDAQRTGAPFCIAINEYPLYLLRSKARENLPALAAELDRQCRGTLAYGTDAQQEAPEQNLLVIDLSLRNPLSPVVAGPMLDRILQDQSLAPTPSLDYNRQRLADPVVKQRLLDLFSRLVDVGVRVTMRELWILLARLVLGYRGDLAHPMGSALDYRYVEVLFAKDRRFFLGEALEFADPARYSHPIWDAILEERDEAAVDGWKFGVPVLGVAGRPDRRTFQALKRSFYFEHAKGMVCFDLEAPDAAAFRKLLRQAADADPKLKRQLIHGLNRAFCTQEFPGCEDNLYLWNGHRFHEQPSRSFLAHRYVPGIALQLLHPRIPARVAKAFP
jgi:Mrp family chromosome partitioning ATPase